MANKKKKPTLLQATTPLIALALLLGVGYGVFGLRAEILLLVATSIAGLIAIRLGYSYREIERGIIENMMKGMPAMLIVIVVGALIGSWLSAGTIPMMIFYGLKLISPEFFLVSACIVCSIISLVTGTSYGTVGTVGVALIGVASGLGIPLEQAAGAIVAGAYFGDKLSPFSDTTNLAPIAAGSNLFDHIRHTLWTTTPAWLLGLAIYLVIGLTADTATTGVDNLTGAITSTIESRFTFHWLLLLPAVITLGAAIFKLPVIPSMLASSAVAVVFAMVFQNSSLVDGVAVMVHGYEIETSNEILDSLLNRGGMISMMDVTLLAFCAFAFGGIVVSTGMMDVILQQLSRAARTAFRAIVVTVLSTITTAVLTGSSFLAILIPGEMLAPIYRKLNLAAKNLSRTTEDSGTVVVPLIPWSIAGVFMAGTLGVDTIAYAPWAIMCYTSFLVAIFYAYTGIAIAPKRNEDETLPGS